MNQTTRNDIPVSQLALPKTSLIECMGVSIGKLNLILCYLPGQSKDNIVFKHFINDIKLLESTGKGTFMVGDFNSNLLYSHLNKSSSSVITPDEHTYCPMSSKFRPSTIALIITDPVLPHSRPWVLHDLSSDHLPVRFNVYTDTKLKCAAEIPIYKTCQLDII